MGVVKADNDECAVIFLLENDETYNIVSQIIASQNNYFMNSFSTVQRDYLPIVPQVICEGRCALTTNFSVFKYMALYSIIQFVSVLILYTSYTNLGDPQFLFVDLFIVTTIAVFMGYTAAAEKLVAQKPLGNLLGAVNLFSVMSQVGWRSWSLCWSDVSVYLLLLLRVTSCI